MADMQEPEPRPPAGRLAGRLLRFRRTVLALAAAGTLFFGLRAARLSTEWDEQAELPANDPDRVEFDRFRERFGGQEYLLVTLRTDDVFAPDFLEYVRTLSTALRDVPQASGVTSLATVPAIRVRNGETRIEPFLPEEPVGAGAAADLRAEALANPLWRGSLVSADGRTACIQILLPAMNPDVNERRAFVAAVRSILAAHPYAGAEVHYTGMSPLADDTMAALQGDLRRFCWLTPALVLGCLFWAFRTWRGVLAPALMIAVAVVWSLGLLQLGGGSLNMCTSMMPTLVAVNGLSYAIHLVNAYHEGCARGGEHRDILAGTLARLAPALGMAALTTAIGFGAQVLSGMRSLQQLGIYSGAGVLVSLLLCLTLLPALLAGLPPPAKAVHRHRALRVLRAGLWGAAAIANRDRGRIPAVLVILLAVSAAGLFRIRMESQWARYLPDTKPSISGLRALERDQAGFYVLEIELEGAPGTFREPWALQAVDRVQRQAAGLPGVDLTVSAVDFLRELQRVRQPEAAAGRGLPATAGQIAEYRLLFAAAGHADLLNAYLTPDGSAARISVRIRDMSTTGHLKLIGEIERRARDLDPRLTLHTTGVVKLFAVHLHALLRGLCASFGLSFLAIAGLMSLQLRSWRAGLCAMIPNVLPVALGFGLLGLLGVPLSAATVMVAAVGIGIAVDDTIHLLLNYRRERAAGHSPEGAVRRSLLDTGRALVFSSRGLAAGFSTLAFSGFRLNREFGLLTAFILLAALVADLFATPYLVRAWGLFAKERP